MLSEWIQTLRNRIASVSPTEAVKLVQGGALLIDVREDSEWASGTPSDAQLVSRSKLEAGIWALADNSKRTILLICQKGTRSLMAANTLENMGFSNVLSVSGGFSQWESEGLPVDRPDAAGLTEIERDRYARHLVMSQIGQAGQTALSKARVLIVGAGGLGSPAALYLAAAGVGTIGLADMDKVERSNLQRQILHDDTLIGWPKVASGAKRLRELNPDVQVLPYEMAVDAKNAALLVSEYDYVVDGTDSYGVRYALNEACHQLQVPYIYGSVFQFEGQVAVFRPWRSEGAPCYRCFQPSAPPAHASPNCAEAGVLGVLPGVIGALQALEVIKLIAGIHSGIDNCIAHFDARGLGMRLFRMPKDRECTTCGTH